MTGARTATCAECGATFEAGARGPLPRWCADCDPHYHRRHSRPVTHCQCGCGAALPDDRRATRRFLGPACKERAARKRIAELLAANKPRKRKAASVAR